MIFSFSPFSSSPFVISDLISTSKRHNKMEEQQLATLLSMEKYSYAIKSLRSHPKRRLVADSLNKVCWKLLFFNQNLFILLFPLQLTDDEKTSDDVFALTMNIFDRFYLKSCRTKVEQNCQLIALSCYNLAKKLRSNTSINNENELISLIFAENYSKDQIFVSWRKFTLNFHLKSSLLFSQDAEQLIVETLDWDLSAVVPHDYLSIFLENFLPVEHDRNKIRLHVQILLSLALCGKSKYFHFISIFISILIFD